MSDTNPSRPVEPTPTMLRKLGGYALKYLLPLAFTVALVWYMFRAIDVEKMLYIIRHGVDYRWLFLAMAISVFSHLARALRWRIQLRALDMHPPFMALACSIFGCYALNLVLPRLGEVWRCLYIARTPDKGATPQQIAARRAQTKGGKDFATVLGSMVADRLMDTLTVLALTFLTFLVAHDAMETFLAKYPIGQDLLALLGSPWFWVAVVGCAALITSVLIWGRHISVVAKIIELARSLWEGFATIGRMKGKWQFLGLTVALWGCYFLQLYAAMYAFSFTRELCGQTALAFGLTPCLVAFVLSSLGMAIPSNGGLGPWNIAVMFGLAVYGITETQGTAFSMVVWSAQTVMLIILGIFTMAYISFSRHNKNIQTPTS